jgi:hypothetical protein
VTLPRPTEVRLTFIISPAGSIMYSTMKAAT